MGCLVRRPWQNARAAPWYPSFLVHGASMRVHVLTVQRMGVYACVANTVRCSSLLPVSTSCPHKCICSATTSFARTPFLRCVLTCRRLFHRCLAGHHLARQSEFLGTSKVKIREAAQATTAAPTFYNPTIIGMSHRIEPT